MMLGEPADRPVWICAPPGSPQSLSPFESRTTSLMVLLSTLVISSMLLVVCWIFFI